MTQSEQQVGSALTESMLNEIIQPGYLPDISALHVPLGTNAEEPSYTEPYLEILEQPKPRGFRFRYPSEGPSHGGLPGQFSTSKSKSYPSVQVNNYQGPCRIVVTLVTKDEPYMLHAHSLTGKNANEEGVVTVQVGPDQHMTASFPNLGIQHVTKKNVVKVLMDRFIKWQTLQNATFAKLSEGIKDGVDLSLFGVNTAINSNKLGFDKNVALSVANQEAAKSREYAKQQAAAMDLSAVRLCFQAYLPDQDGNFTRPLKPVYSDAVLDSKAPSASQLKICRMDKNSGCVTGGDEIYLLCDKVQKDDIEIHFYEMDDITGKYTWEDLGKFSPCDVHRQFAIVFKTPPYWNIAIERPANVLVELRRKKNGGETSEPVQFTYQPQLFDKEAIGAKRRKTVPHFTEFLSGGSSGATGGGGSSVSGFNFSADFLQQGVFLTQNPSNM
ncbi:predicted protein [Nematostella vectensis]|uniref:RHD domain-containing protein n=1 Tax=Nematostella vectensis TaxID=45351 RepID=A7STR4_NEMVE|nr:predicted protein [Nematostella vectensis]|eukprot:XP_001625023.1 predicted protein [Nematostella vectensis]